MSTLLSKKTDYALLILAHLHEHPTGGSAREIADRFSLSKAFLANILKELCQKGFLVSHRGVNGGYELRRPAGEVNLAEILEAMEDGLALTSCSTHHPTESEECSVMNMCPIRGPMIEINRRVTEALRSVKLSELLEPIISRTTTFQPVLPVLNQLNHKKTLEETTV
ncbi:RrF2 family transcriptional regulator [Zavarzinella formosa]|uniref:RrF2 family transcriptional regulator n=1 Tax=Zavarzinella formosa TaxID=360055 RepID=UPI0002E3AC51|nr:Rrf2 family transcriptional regulator [Zavarzinella formosa]